MLDLFAHMMLADHVANPGGKLYINGGGWAIRTPNPMPWALALDVRVPWTYINRKFTFTIDLLTGDGAPFTVTDPAGNEQPVQLSGGFSATPHPGLKPGSTITTVAGVNLPPLALPPHEQFEFRLAIDGETRDDWRVTFATVAAAQTAAQAG